MADENKPAFYPRVGNIKAKNFVSAQPVPFIEDPRAMELPQYSEFIPKLGTVDLSVPSKENRELNRRITQRDADLMRQVQADRSPLEKLAGGIQAGRFLGSALTQGINSIPTRLVHGDEAADKFIQDRIYKPEQPLAYEYAQDVGDFLEKLETEYKIPPVLPEAVALQFLTGPATSQAMRVAGKGVEQAGRAVERSMEPVVKGALERGGLPREMVMAMGANTPSNVIKPSGKGANWLDGKRGSVEAQLGKMKMADQTSPEEMAQMQSSIDTAKRIMGDDPKVQRAVGQMENELSTAKRNNAINSWIDSNLRNYVKNQMATPDDPVRRLAEEGILHMAPYGDQSVVSSRLMNKRMGLGQDPLGMGKSDAAKFWERQADISVDAYPAGSYKHGSLDESILADNPWLQKVPDETMIYTGKGLGGDLGFDHIIDVLREDVATGRIRPEQLNKVSMEQAVRRTHEYDQELARKMNEARNTARADLPVYKDYPEGYRWIELNKPGSFAAESDAMGHSVRGYEPPKGHPDWTEGSGNSGSSSYGLGGWDAIKSGEAKVYSLVDSKGEPHTTIEIGKGKHPIGFTGDGNNFPYGLRYGDHNNNYLEIPEEKQLEIYNLGKKLYFENPNAYAENRVLTGAKAPNLMDSFQKAADMLLGEKPGYIKQIKGKQNRAPKEEYLPYVQDFVKGSDWSDVGDLQNAGFIEQHSLDRKIAKDVLGLNLPKYTTKQEAKDYMILDVNRHHTGAKQLEIPESLLKYKIQPDVPPAGMKAGGKVSISNNPDTMMLEVNNQKMKNGVPAYGAGKAVTKMGLKAAKNEVPRLAMQFGNDLPLNMADDLIKRSPSVDRINMNYKDVTKRVPELTEAAQRLQAGELDRETYAKLVQALKPVKPYDFVPKPATADEARGALREDARDLYGVPSRTLEAGSPVGLRLDIPAYRDSGVWVPTIHEQDAGFGAGKKIGHESVASVLNPEFGMSEKAALSIASGKPKGTIATIKGDWNPTSEADIIAKAKEYLKHPEWRQVGMDPERHSYFYDRETMAPVVNAEEVIQIGPLVLAKNPKFGKPEDFKYAKGGITGAINLGLKAARPVVSDADRALPLRLTRAMPKSADEINAHAERVARQMMGEHVTSGKAGDTKNLAGRSMKESQRVKALEYELEPTKVVPESQVYQPRIGDINVALGGDFTVSDVMLKRLMGEEVNSKQEGGSRYGLGHMKAKTPLFYASNEVPAQAVQNKVTDLYDLFGPERVMGHHMAMGPIATNFAQHFADANLRYTDYSKLTPENMLMFDQLMAKGYEITKKNPKTGEVTTKVVDFPRWPGIANPEAAYKAMRENSEMRKFYNRVMQTPSITEPLGLPNGLDVRYAITSPDLRDMEVNLTGHGVGELVPYANLTDTARHKTYSKGIPGMYAGHQEVLTPFAISFPDAAQHIISTQRPQDFTGTIQKVFPHQRVDQQFIDEMEQYRRRIKELTGKKKGGAVNKAEGGYLKKPAAYINGDEFVNAAKKYGIKDSMNNLNKIVDLVNKGLSVDDAARQVADSGVHKAAGGAIRGDDLILEERPL